MSKEGITKHDIGSVILEDLLESGTIRSCANCDFRKENICTKYNAQPPISVIMTGCDAWILYLPF